MKVEVKYRVKAGYTHLGLTHLFTYTIFISTLLLPTYSGGQGGLRWAIKRTTDLIHFFISHRMGIGWR